MSREDRESVVEVATSAPEGVPELLAELRVRRIRCRVEGESLRLRAPRGSLTPELEAELRRRKPEIVAYLRSAQGVGPASVPSLEPVPRSGPVPLSFAQERLWFLQQLAPESTVFHLQSSLPLEGRLDLGALERAVTEVVRRHEVLRTTYEEEDGRPLQRIGAAAAVPVPVTDLGSLPPAEREAGLRRVATEERLRPMDLARGPLLRAHLVVLSEAAQVLVITQHHIVTDGWSIALTLEELTAHYAAFRAGRPSPLGALKIQYADYAVRQREWLSGDVLEEQLSFWRDRLAGPLPLLALPTDRPRPPVQTLRAAAVPLRIPRDLNDRIKQLGRGEGVTPFMTLLTAFEVLLQRYTGQDDVLVGTASGSRPWVETEDLVGLFVNTLVLRSDLSGDPSFREALGRVRRVALDAYAHAELPFEKLVEELRPPRDLSRSPLAQALFVIQNTPLESLAEGASESDLLQGERGTAGFDVSLYLIESAGGLTGLLEYSTDLFEEATAVRMAEHYRNLLEAAVSDADTPLSRLSLLSAGERERLVIELNRSEAPLPESARVHRLFESQAVRRADDLAVVCRGESLRYGELDARANRLGHHLRQLGVGPGVRVGLFAERSLDMVVGLLAVLKAGGAYVPLDPGFPDERLAYMLDDARPRVLLTQRALAGRLEGHGAHSVLFDAPALERFPSGPLPGGAGPEDLAYVIYTSGSTGRPKGVEIPHRALSNLLLSVRERPGIAERDVLLSVTTLSFDIAALELFLPLVTGARLVVATRDEASDGALLQDLVQASGATVMQATPATWRMLLEAGWSGAPGLAVLSGGEALPAALARALRTRGQSLWNLYGPTETTIWSTAQPLEGEIERVPIGRPLANTRLYVLDDRLEPTPTGVPGELYIGGAGLARGYHRRPGLTAERFVPDPFGVEPGGRLYRTGDLARYRNDGSLECLGRVDTQVKVRGFRIELGEVEAALREHPRVRDAAAAALEEEEGLHRLVAYLVGEEGEAPPVGELRSFLAGRLPDYMLPSAFVSMAALPLTPNGKVDRRALPAPEPGRPALEREYAAPRGPTERDVAEIWSRVLRVERVGIHDDFFELGGHSLTATQVLSRIQRRLGVQIPLQRVFETPTVAGLAEAVETGRREESADDAPAIAPVPRDEELPLSFAQERLWYLDQLEPASAAYNIAGGIRFEGALDADALERALIGIRSRHEALRTTFDNVDGRPLQRIHPPGDFPLERADLRGGTADERAEAARRITREEPRLPFDLARGPLVRARLVLLGPDDALLLITVHHSIADALSMRVLIRELGALYEAFRHGRPSPLPPLEVQYADYARWQREWLSGPVLERQMAYWREKLADVPVLNLPTDRPRPPLQTFDGAVERFWIPGATVEKLRELGRRERATFFMVLLAAFQAVLHRQTGQDDVSVGSPIAGRNRSELEPLIGLFVNTLVLRTDLSGDPSFTELLARVRATALGAYAHQDMPFEKLVEELQPKRNLSVNPLFQVMLSLQDARAARPGMGGVALSQVPVETGTSRFDLTLFAVETAGGLGGSLEYNTDLFDPATARRLLGHLRTLLEAVAARPDRRLSELPLLTPGERQELRDWNDTALADPARPFVHERFAERAAERPEAVALVPEAEGQDGLTYGALAARASALAARLRRRGVGPGVLVGVFLERSAEMVVALLGVLEAGGAYLPLDPGFPAERLRFMLEDSGAGILVTEESLRSEVPEGPWEVLTAESGDAGPDRDPPRSAPGPEDLAYVIYTSGSTGRPKGVEVPHRALANLLTAMGREPGLDTGDCLLSVTTLSFDIAALELFLPLVTGARLAVARRETAADGTALLEAISRTGATAVQATPATWRLLLEAGWSGTPRIRVLCGGEVLPGQLAAELVRRAELWNLYGPTETTIWSAAHRVERAADTAGPVPLGHAIANTQIHVLDRHLGPVPTGVAGELFIGGAGVARGYRGRPDLTAERFLPDPFRGEPGARLYATGDLVRRRHDGTLEFLGRLDHQVKLRGFRIELGEIEEALLQHPGVSAAAVVTPEAVPEERRLAAYVVFDPDHEPTVTELRRHLKKRLPAYMIPASFVSVEALPLTPNGKVDRRALSLLDREAQPEVRRMVEPRSPTERAIAETWREVLGIAGISVTDNFFDLGGHSLLSMRVIAALEKKLGVAVGPREMIFQTLEQLAAMCDERAATRPTTSPS